MAETSGRGSGSFWVAVGSLAAVISAVVGIIAYTHSQSNQSSAATTSSDSTAASDTTSNPVTVTDWTNRVTALCGRYSQGEVNIANQAKADVAAANNPAVADDLNKQSAYYGAFATVIDAVPKPDDRGPGQLVGSIRSAASDYQAESLAINRSDFTSANNWSNQEKSVESQISQLETQLGLTPECSAVL